MSRVPDTLNDDVQLVEPSDIVVTLCPLILAPLQLKVTVGDSIGSSVVKLKVIVPPSLAIDVVVLVLAREGVTICGLAVSITIFVLPLKELGGKLKLAPFPTSSK